MAVRAQTFSEPGRGLPFSLWGAALSTLNWFFESFFQMCLHLCRCCCSPAFGEEPPRSCSLLRRRPPLAESCPSIPTERSGEQGASAHHHCAEPGTPAGTWPTCSRGWAKAPRAEVPPAEVPLSNRASKCDPSPLSALSRDPRGRRGMGDPCLSSHPKCRLSVEQQKVGVCWELMPNCATLAVVLVFGGLCAPSQKCPCSPWDVQCLGCAQSRDH